MNTITKEGLFIDNACLGKDMLLVSVTPNFEYVENVRQDNILGYKYTVVLPQHGYEKLDVKIAGKKLLDVQTGQSLPVSFEALRVKPYVPFKEPVLKFTAEAEGITPKR